MKSINMILVPTGVAIIMALTVLFTGILSAGQVSAQAVNPTEASCEALGDVSGADCGSGEEEVQNTVQAVINILLAVIGFAAVIMLIVGGIRYVVSGGDQQSIASAKDTIIYAIVGIVVALMAFAIVNFVLNRL